jgi:anaerobic selenocysteine-containing dehydrogenase
LVAVAVARANPSDLARLGIESGDPVRVRSGQGQLTVPAEADAGVPKGVLVVEFNVGSEPGDTANAAATLIDATAVVNDVRLETV